MRLPLKQANQPAACEDVPLHSGFDLRPLLSHRKIQLYIQRIEREDVVVRRAWRRTGASIADLAEIIAPLKCAVPKLVRTRHSLAKRARPGGQVIEHPVGEGSAGRVWVGDN